MAGSSRLSYFPLLVPCLQGVSSDCVVGEGVQLGEKVSVKHSSLGHHCNIGDRRDRMSVV